MNQDVVLLLVALLGLALTVGSIVYVFGLPARGEATTGDDVHGQVRGAGGRRGMAGLRRRAGRARGAEEDDDEEGEGQPLTKKQLKKEIKKKEKEDLRRFDEAQRQAKQKRQSAKDEAYRKKQEAQEEEERKKEEHEAKLKADEEAKEKEEYEQWKNMFSVEDEGETRVETEKDSQNKLQEFINYIKEKKVVLIEDLAAEFGLHAQDAINRVETLEQKGLITGLTDDRGKFIYLTKEELEAVAKFIQKRGRISISELAAESNRLIKLEGEKKARITDPSPEEDAADGLQSDEKITLEAVGRDR